MSQDLRTISTDVLRLEVYKLTISQIKQLMEAIYEYKRSSIGVVIACDLERKETILESEMTRRKYLQHKRKPQDLVDYHNWKFNKLSKKKRLF